MKCDKELKEYIHPYCKPRVRSTEYKDHVYTKNTNFHSLLEKRRQEIEF